MRTDAAFPASPPAPSRETFAPRKATEAPPFELKDPFRPEPRKPSHEPVADQKDTTDPSAYDDPSNAVEQHESNRERSSEEREETPREPVEEDREELAEEPAIASETSAEAAETEAAEESTASEPGSSSTKEPTEKGTTSAAAASTPTAAKHEVSRRPVTTRPASLTATTSTSPTSPTTPTPPGMSKAPNAAGPGTPAAPAGLLTPTANFAAAVPAIATSADPSVNLSNLYLSDSKLLKTLQSPSGTRGALSASEMLRLLPEKSRQTAPLELGRLAVTALESDARAESTRPEPARARGAENPADLTSPRLVAADPTGQQTAAARGAEAASAPVELSPAILQHLERMRRTGRSWMRVALKLADGRDLRVKFGMRGNDVSVTFYTDSRELSDSLSKSWSRLSDWAGRHGMQLQDPAFAAQPATL